MYDMHHVNLQLIFVIILKMIADPCLICATEYQQKALEQERTKHGKSGRWHEQSEGEIQSGDRIALEDFS
jgi:hypothetical protein